MWISHIIAICSLAVAFTSLIISGLKERKKNTKDSQRLYDKLDTIIEDVNDVRGDLARINNTLFAHDRDLAKINTKIEEHDRRLNKLES